MKNTAKKDHSKRKKRTRVFRIITWSLSLLFLFLIEVILRLASSGENLNLFIENPAEGYEEYMIVNPSVGNKYFQRLESTSPPNDIFLKRKSKGTFRIFVMGSSTVAGFPYEDNLMFSRMLHRRLESAHPDQNIEVVNTAITAINSYTLYDYTRQIIRQQPDAVLIYAGHNEFYGAFGVGSNESMSRSHFLSRLHLICMDLRFYQLLRKLFAGALNRAEEDQGKRVHGTLMKRIVADDGIIYGGKRYQIGMQKYRENMGRILHKFEQNQIPVFLSEVVSNEKDLPPLSYLSSGEENEAWLAFRSAKEAYEKGDYKSAGILFNKARDLDGIRFRATGELNQIIHALSKEYFANLVPMLQVFTRHSPHGIIGNELMTEHVHPNVKGSFLMAEAFFSSILQSGLLANPNQSKIYPPSYETHQWGYTVLDTLLAHHRISSLKSQWPFVPADAPVADYRRFYKPVSFLDSLVFTTWADPGTSLDSRRLILADAYKKEGNYDEAYREYEAILCTNPYLALNYRDAATMLIQLGDLPRALDYFKKSQKYEPSFYAAYRMGEIMLIKGDYKSARSYFEQAFSLTRDNSERIKTLGKLYMSCMYAGQEKDAEAIAGQLKQYDALQLLNIPERQYTYTQYIPFQSRKEIEQAKQMAENGREEEALQVLNHSLSIYDSHYAHRLIGELLVQAKSFEQALSHFQRVYDEFRFDPDFLGQLIMVYLALDKKQQANDQYKHLKRLDPEYPALSGLGLILSQAGN